MRSKDIAKRARVTVRTLRHYHQIGLLPEPSRDANGYRHYTVHHLVRLLRIRRLTTLGLSLRQLAPLLEDSHALRLDVLDQLATSLTDQIERLQKQRKIIAALRSGKGPLDVSPELTVALAPLEVGRSGEVNNSGRDQSTLIDHMVNDKGRAALAELYDRLAAPDLAKIVLTLGQRFDRLGLETDETEIADLVDAYVLHLGNWMKEFNAVLRQFADKETSLTLWAHAAEATTPQQRRVLTEIGLRLVSTDGRNGSCGK